MLLDDLRQKGLVVVESSGPETAKLVFVGEALGDDDVLKGRLFSGMAGLMLDWLIGVAGGQRSQVYVTNVVPIRPKDNKLSNLSLLGLEVQDFYPSLYERLKKVNPNCIVALGTTALVALTDQSEVSKWRGSLLWSEEVGCKVMATFHPSFVQRLGDKDTREEITEGGIGGVKYDYGAARVSLMLDIKRAMKESQTKELPKQEHTLVTKPSIEEVFKEFKFLHSCESVAFDIETTRTTGQILCIGFCGSPNRAFCVPLVEEYWHSNLALVKKEVADFLFSHKGLIAQNATFDMTYLMPEYPVKLLHFDTMIAHHTVYPELPHGLAFLSSVYTTLPFYKWMSSEDLYKYNCLDAIATWIVARELKKELKEFGLEDFFYGYTMPLFHLLLQMGWTGIDVDSKELDRMDLELEGEASILAKEIETKAGVALNVRSPKQVCEFLYRKLKLPIQNKRGSNKETADEDALDKLYKKTQNPLLFTILQARQKLGMQSKFTRAKKDWDGKIRTNYSISSTDTGRLSSKKTIFKTGLNLQNVPREAKYRRVFIAQPGWKLIEADLEQAEARLVAWFAQDKVLIDFLLSGGDIHRWNASIIFSTTMEKITTEQRYFAKRVVHGFNYGLGPGHLVDMARLEANVFITMAEAKVMKAKYFAGCPSVVKWHGEIERIMSKGDRTLVTPFGRRRTFYGRPGPDLHRKMVAFTPQSTCVDYANTAMVRIALRFPEGKAHMLLQTHDGMVATVRDEVVKDCRQIMLEELATRLVIHNRDLVIPAAIKIGQNWGDVREEEK
jgi:DNA polymerase-1